MHEDRRSGAARVVIASCRALPGWEVDDRALYAALEGRGVALTIAAWDDEAIDWARFDGCLIRTTWDYSGRREEFCRWAAAVEAQTRLFNSAGLVRWNTHKRYLRDLEAAGATLAPTRWLARAEVVDVAAVMAAEGWPRGLIKPLVGASSRETIRFDADAAGLRAAQAHVDRLLPGEDLAIQRYLPSVESEGEFSIILIDGGFSHGVRKIPVAGDFRVQDDFGALDEPWSPPAALIAEASAMVATLEGGGPPLYARVDLLRDDAGRFVLNELEIVEPSLFFRGRAAPAERLVDALLRRLAGAGAA
jgi:glutathione synthase/RimK-type ligase-like ATP-grasp enzyme